MKTRDANRGARKIVFWSDEDGCYVGMCPELFYGGVHGSNEFKVYRELCQMISEVKRLNRTSKYVPHRSRTRAK